MDRPGAGVTGSYEGVIWMLGTKLKQSVCSLTAEALEPVSTDQMAASSEPRVLNCQSGDDGETHVTLVHPSPTQGGHSPGVFHSQGPEFERAHCGRAWAHAVQKGRKVLLLEQAARMAMIPRPIALALCLPLGLWTHVNYQYLCGLRVRRCLELQPVRVPQSLLLWQEIGPQMAGF